MKKAINWIVLITIFVGLVSVFANVRNGVFSPLIQPFNVLGFSNDEIIFKSGFYDDKTVINQYPLGNLVLNSGVLTFNCVDKTREFLAPQPRNDCWTNSLNNKKAINNENLDFIDFTARFEAKGKFVRDLGFLSYKDQNSIWHLKLSPETIILQKTNNPFLIKQNAQTKGNFVINSKIDGLKAGVIIKETRGILRQEKVSKQNFILSQGQNIYLFNIPTDSLGTNKISIDAFVELYDFNSGFTNQDTGYCFVDKHDKKVCVNTKMIPVSQPIIYDFNIVAQDVDITKNIKTSCTTNSQCPQNFECKQNICEYQGVVTNSLIQNNTLLQLWNWIKNLLKIN